MLFSSKFGLIVSFDIAGWIEYWEPHTASTPSSPDFPANPALRIKNKFSSDVCCLLKRKTYALSATLSPAETYFSVVTKDRMVHIFELASGLVLKTINLSLPVRPAHPGAPEAAVERRGRRKA